MKYTGERVIPKVMNPRNGMLIEHIARYEFAKQYAKGRVLDIACGVGYGSEILIKGNIDLEDYIGMDNDKETIDYAKSHYAFFNASYHVEDCLDKTLPERYEHFDTIISMETIEHFHGDTLFLDNLYKMLKSKGKLIISTPFGRGVGEPCANEYHVHQYKEEEFLERLQIFDKVEMYHQIDTTIEMPKPEKKYYLMVAVCTKY